ncbi:MAG: 1-deoxy-D-xylulose-5-phosphate synthase, partial [Lachnospiraceae bacterium]|nr:1-deoxy-D-xylulose-5-phosphate synthase [Lachnospiraceae bacterium]
HSATSVSAGLGLAKAKMLKGDSGCVVSVIGDGSFTGGMVFEALNNGGRSKANHIVVLNDNKMSISENVGAFAKYLAVIRSRPQYYSFKANTEKVLNKVPFGEKIVKEIYKVKTDIKNRVYEKSTFFEDLGYRYMGPIDGHNIENLCDALQSAKSVNGPVLLHVITVKGKGYEYAEKDPSVFHGISKFDVDTGEAITSSKSYSDKFGEVLCNLAENDDSLCAITAAMGIGTGLGRFSELYPKRFFDVGIAEEHAVTFAGGLAKSGLIPVFAVYSSFLQRAYDQILHDVCIQNLHVVFAIYRAGLVGSDGETHQGIFDISYLSTIPNMTILAPKNKWELSDMMKFAVAFDGPVAVRYPRGLAYDGLKDYREEIELGKSECIYKGCDIAIMALGSMVSTAENVILNLKNEGYNATLINARFAMPFDKKRIKKLAKKHKLLVTMEENVASGGFGEHVGAYIQDENIPIELLKIAIPDTYVEHGNVDILKKELRIDADSVSQRILEKYNSICKEVL